MRGNLLLAMSQGIDDCDLVVVFVTRLYIDKNKKLENDNCKVEFNYAYNRKQVQRLITVVMEDNVQDTRTWDGSVGATLGSNIYTHFAGDTAPSEPSKINELLVEIHRKMQDLAVTPPPPQLVTQKSAPCSSPLPPCVHSSN